MFLLNPEMCRELRVGILLNDGGRFACFFVEECLIHCLVVIVNGLLLLLC